ncbi:MAG: sulfur carrier protein ThiS [Acidobacteriota bacterium]|nr:sulfur carrier protein ThiS [Acidobacteriota bacterium]
MIVVNGSPADAAPGDSLLVVLAALGVDRDSKGVAVALDGEVVARADWERVRLSDGARVEVLTAMQGG